MKKTPASIFMACSRWLFLGVVFLVPVVVLPWTTDVFETNKQLTLMLGVTLSAACFMLSYLLERRSLARPGFVILAPFMLLAATVVSAITSLAPMTSWLGQGAQEYVSVLSLVGFELFFFLAASFTRQAQGRRDLLCVLFASSAVVSLVFLPIFFGLDTGLFTNLIGTPHALAVYLLLISTLACGHWLGGARLEPAWSNRIFNVLAALTFIVTLLVLLALDSSVIWILALVSSGILFLVALLHADKFQDPLRFAPSMMVFVLALIFLVLPTHVPSPFLQEVAPNLRTTWNVVQGAWNEGSVAFGTGPGTFALVYPKYVALDVNNTDFWDTVFDRGNSHVTTELATVGVVGVLTWIFFVVLILVLASKKIFSAGEGWKEILPIFAAWLVLSVAALVYAQDFVLSSVFWLLSAVLTAMLVPEPEVVKHQARARLATVLVAVVVFVCFVATLFVALPRYRAEVVFAKAVKHNVSADSALEVDEVIGLLDKAAATNPWNDTYYRNLSAAVLRRLGYLTSDEAADSEYVQSLIATALESTSRATELSPKNVMNWDVRGLVYRQLLSVVPDAVQPAIEAYETAIELAPTNPRYQVEVARVYLALADLQTPYLDNNDQGVADQAKTTQEGAYNQAEDHLLTAVALKSDYAPAQYYLALLRERQGQLAEAVRGLELVKAQSPNDVGVGLELGLLYLRQGKNELAQAELQRVIGLAPAYANAHWYLSVVFEQKGDLPGAIAEAEKVLETNPDNVTVQTRLDRLKAGQTSDVIPDPVTTTP